MASLQDRYDGNIIATTAESADLVLIESHKVLAYDVGTTYPINKIVYVSGVLYKSLQNSNTGHSVSDGAWWLTVGAGELNGINVGKAMTVADLGDAVIEHQPDLTTLTNDSNADSLHKHTAAQLTDISTVMLKATYDTGGDGIVDNAAKVNGVDAAGNSKYYGTNGSGTAGFYALPDSGTQAQNVISGTTGTLTKNSMNILTSATAGTYTMPTLADGEMVGLFPRTSGHTINYDGVRSFWITDGTTATSFTVAAAELGMGEMVAFGTTYVGGLK